MRQLTQARCLRRNKETFFSFPGKSPFSWDTLYSNLMWYTSRLICEICTSGQIALSTFWSTRLRCWTEKFTVVPIPIYYRRMLRTLISVLHFRVKLTRIKLFRDSTNTISSYSPTFNPIFYAKQINLHSLIFHHSFFFLFNFTNLLFCLLNSTLKTDLLALWHPII